MRGFASLPAAMTTLLVGTLVGSVGLFLVHQGFGYVDAVRGRYGRGLVPGANVSYSLSICVVFKDEARYLAEWLEHHLLVGVEHFYMYNDNSTDGFEQVLAAYVSEGTVSLIKWPAEPSDLCDQARIQANPKAVSNCQLEAFTHCLANYGLSNKWLMFTDIDEFVFPVDEYKTYKLPVILEAFEGAHSIALISRSFGSSGHVWRPLGLVTENYMSASPRGYDGVDRGTVAEEAFWSEMFKVKSIVNPKLAKPGRCGAHVFFDVRKNDSKAISAVATDLKPLRLGCRFASLCQILKSQ